MAIESLYSNRKSSEVSWVNIISSNKSSVKNVDLTEVKFILLSRGNYLNI